jgi:hypothetical protein
MKTSAYLLVLALTTLSGCGLIPGPTPCVGAYSGTISGDMNGTITGSFESDGSYSLTITAALIGGGMTYSSATGTVEADGTIHNSGASALILSGSTDESNCTASGTWTYYASTGQWSVVKD